MTGSNHIGSWQGNGALNIGPWQGGGTVGPVAPFIIEHPLSQTIENGLLVTFNVVAGGTEPLSYQWYLNGILQIGETGTSYSYTVDLTNDGDEIWVVVSNVAGSVQSNSAFLSVFDTAEISDLEYFTREQPDKSEEIVNRVVVTIKPLIPNGPQELFKMSDEFTLSPTESEDFRLYYKKQPALETGAVTTLEDPSGGILTIASETYYPWGVEVTVENNDVTTGSAKIQVVGTHLEVAGEQTIIEEAEDEILRYGVQEHEYADNHLLQSVDFAQQVATNLLSSYKTLRKDTSVVWRGNPALELGDKITVPEYRRGDTVVNGTFKIVKNQIEYDGTLREKTDGRKV